MPPILETNRLILRPPREEDLEQAYALGSNPEVMRYIRPDGALDLEGTRDELRYRMEFNRRKLGYWVVETRDSHAFVGWMALRYMEKSTEVEIGFRYGPEHWGKGFATEAGARVLWYGFWELELPEIVAVAMPANGASLRVLEKLGMRVERYGMFYDCYCARLSVERQSFIRKHRSFQL